MNGSKSVIGVDIAKRVFQLHWIDAETGEIENMQLKREKFLEYFTNRAQCLIGMEACGGAQHWVRKLIELGHEVKRLPARMIKPFVGRNKSDAADARAIWTAVQQPAVKVVAIKSEAQQAMLALHRMRSQLVKFRTAQINGLRGLLAEYGEVMPQGRAGITKGIAPTLAKLVDRLPAVLLDTLREQWARVGQLDEQVAEIERMGPPLFDYPHRGKAARGALLAYLRRTTGYSRAQITRLVARWTDNRTQRNPLINRYRAPCSLFASIYAAGGVALLVQTDKANEDRCGPAIAHLLRRAFGLYDDARYERLAGQSPSQLYHLRKRADWQSPRARFVKTRAVCSAIGVRKAPRPAGHAGYVHIDTGVCIKATWTRSRASGTALGSMGFASGKSRPVCKASARHSGCWCWLW